MTMSHVEVKRDPLDDSVIVRVYLNYVLTTEEVLSAKQGVPPLGTIYLDRGAGATQIVFSLDRGPERRQRHFAYVDPVGNQGLGRWLLVKLAPGVWDIPQSIHFPGQFHGFVTLLGVPDPAPWELGVDSLP